MGMRQQLPTPLPPKGSAPAMGLGALPRPGRGSTGGPQAGNSVSGPKGSADHVAQFGKGSAAAQVAMSPDQMFQDMLSKDDAAWKEKQGVLQDQMGLFQRQAMNLNARTGGTIAGGYASMAGAALGKGMDAFNKGAMEHGDRRRQLMLAWMDRKLQDKRRQEERGWQLEDTANAQAHNIEMTLAQMTGDVPRNW